MPFQLKARRQDSGTDILWESVKPWNDKLKNNFERLQDAAFTGKDMRCRADLLFAVSGDTLRIRKIQETMDIAKLMTSEFIRNMRSTGKAFVSTRWGEARLVTDRSNQATATMSGPVQKINCFIKPDAYTWKKDVQI